MLPDARQDYPRASDELKTPRILNTPLAASIGRQAYERRAAGVCRLLALCGYRHVVVRYERHAENFLGMLLFACCLILLRCL